MNIPVLFEGVQDIFLCSLLLPCWQ
ncbi:hypothetical protein [Chryseobacterium aurantiacum]